MASSHADAKLTTADEIAASVPDGITIALTGSGGIAAISAGIAEALITTAFGLFVAVPAVWAYNYLSSRVEGFNVEMDNSSSELLDYFIKKGA